MTKYLAVDGAGHEWTIDSGHAFTHCVISDRPFKHTTIAHSRFCASRKGADAEKRRELKKYSGAHVEIVRARAVKDTPLPPRADARGTLSRKGRGKTQTSAATLVGSRASSPRLAFLVRKDGASARLKRIAEIIEHVDDRCAAVDGPVTPTLEEMTQAELSRIYALAKGKPERWRP